MCGGLNAMKTPSGWQEFLASAGAAFLVLFLVAGCAYGSPRPVPPPSAAAAQVVVPTATQRAGSSSTDAAALLRGAAERNTAVRTARGLIALEIRGAGSLPAEPLTTTIEFEYAKPNIRLTAKQRPSAPHQVEMILTNEAAYVGVEDQWLATTPGTRPTEVKLLGFDALPAFLQAAVKPRLVGPQEVRGVPCTIIGFDLAPDKLQELGNLAAFKRAARDGVTVDGLEAEVAIGADDGRARRLSLVVRGRENGGSKAAFVMAASVDLWDFDAPDIAVAPPGQADILDLDGLLGLTPAPTAQ